MQQFKIATSHKNQKPAFWDKSGFGTLIDYTFYRFYGGSQSIMISITNSNNKSNKNIFDTELQDHELPIAYGRAIPPFTPFKLNKKYHRVSWDWLVIVRCPFCGKQHLHGWGKDNLKENKIHTRLSHCTEGDRYQIVIGNKKEEGKK